MRTLSDGREVRVGYDKIEGTRNLKTHNTKAIVTMQRVTVSYFFWRTRCSDGLKQSNDMEVRLGEQLGEAYSQCRDLSHTFSVGFGVSASMGYRHRQKSTIWSDMMALNQIACLSVHTTCTVGFDVRMGWDEDTWGTRIRWANTIASAYQCVAQWWWR